MERMLSQPSVESKSNSNLSTLKGALERLGMTTLALEFVATHKRENLEQITHSLCPDLAREITEDEFSSWDGAELRRMCKDDQLDDRPMLGCWHHLHKQGC